MRFIKLVFLYVAWTIAIIGTMASLYSSAVKGFEICHLCWYQRICLYPMVIMLGMACYEQSFAIAKYLLPLSLIGMLLALYQYLEQMIPGFAPIDVCGDGPSCNAIHMKLWGFVTLPLLSLLAFLAIALCLTLICCVHKDRAAPN
jgi:disulfide bond formation protein DsbB